MQIKKNSKVLLEKNILDGAIPGKVRVASSQVFDKRHVLLFDSNQHSGFQLGDEPQKVRVSFSKPEKVICYSITFRSEDRTNFRIPKHKFSGRIAVGRDYHKVFPREEFAQISGTRQKFKIDASEGLRSTK